MAAVAALTCLHSGRPQIASTTANVDKFKHLAVILLKVSLNH